MMSCAKLLRGLCIHCKEENELQSDDSRRLSEGEFLKILSTPQYSDVVKKVWNKSITVATEDNQPSILSREDVDTLLLTAVSALQLFVQHNWTGPITLTPQQIANDVLNIDIQEFEAGEKRVLEDDLCIDGESVYERLHYPSLLYIARSILSSTIKHQHKTTLWLIWEMRSVFIHQSMIDERCNTLKLEAIRCVNILLSTAGIKVKSDSPHYTSIYTPAATDGDHTEPTATGTRGVDDSDIVTVSPDESECLNKLISWQLEAAWISRYYFEHRICKTLLESAQAHCGVNIQLDGVPGKRTRYQQKDIAQLVLKVTSTSDTVSEYPQYDTSVCDNVPKEEPLQDDTVLDRLKLTNQEPADSSEGGTSHADVTADWLQQCLILALCEENRYVKAADADADITEEETLAYINYMLIQPVDWSVQCKSLMIRSIVEKHSGRRIERSLRQLEYLSTLLSSADAVTGAASLTQRLRGVYSSCLPPSWQIQKSLGDLQMDIGVYASAMEVFDRLGLWNPLIVCCQRAGRTGKAEELIRQRLSVSETAPLYCSLSDVTADPQYYHKAWELSNQRSARAMRGLAFHYLRATEYEKCMEYFEKTLALNPLQLGCWFSYGCASLASAKFDKAATAFRRCVILNEDNFEAWNNLAAAYIRNKQKARGFAVLQDAIKCSFDNWKVWENYSLVGSDCGQFSEVIRAAHRILDLRGKWEDEMVVKHLTKCIMDDEKDAFDKPSSVHREAMLKLLGHTTSKVTTNSVIWACYGRLILHTDDNNSTPENAERGIQCLQKSYRCASNSSNWEKSEDICTDNTNLLLELIEAYKLVNNKKYGSTGKLQVKSHIARISKAHTDPVTKHINSDCIRELLVKLESALTVCEDMVKNSTS